MDFYRNIYNDSLVRERERERENYKCYLGAVGHLAYICLVFGLLKSIRLNGLINDQIAVKTNANTNNLKTISSQKQSPSLTSLSLALSSFFAQPIVRYSIYFML
jgi:hypothetical protein